MSEPFRLSWKSVSKAKYATGALAKRAAKKAVEYAIDGAIDCGEDLIGEMPAGVALDRASISQWIWRESDRERKNGRLLEKIELSFHPLLDRESYDEVIRDFIRAIGAEGRCPWFAAKHLDRDTWSNHNPHAHVLLRNRSIDGNSRRAVLTAFQKLGATELLRACWADVLNKHLEAQGTYARVDHRSHYRRAQDVDPGRTPLDKRAGTYLSRRRYEAMHADASESSELTSEHRADTGSAITLERG